MMPKLMISRSGKDATMTSYPTLVHQEGSPVRVFLLQALELVQHCLQRPITNELNVFPPNDLHNIENDHLAAPTHSASLIRQHAGNAGA